MATKLNTEFNYRFQVQGETTWEKIKTIKGFLEGRIRAAALEEASRLKLEAKRKKVKWLIENNSPEHVILEEQAELLELESHQPALEEGFALNKQEIAFLESYLEELYAEAEQTRLPGYSDEQMFEHNAALEFTTWTIKEIQAEIIANGRPSSARIRNAMSNPMTFAALKQFGLIHQDTVRIAGAVQTENGIKFLTEGGAQDITRIASTIQAQGIDQLSGEAGNEALRIAGK